MSKIRAFDFSINAFELLDIPYQMPFKDFVEHITLKLAEYSKKTSDDAIIYIESDDGELPSISIVSYRDENDKEYTERLKSITKCKDLHKKEQKRIAAAEKKLYLKLKKKYERSEQ